MLAALFPGTRHLQNVHPLLVHLPLGLLPAAALFYVVAWWTGRASVAWAGYWALALGALGAAAAAASGLYAQTGVMVDPSVRAALLEPHERLMLGAVALGVGLAGWASVARPFPERARAAFVALLLVLIAGIAKGADYGGRMVYEYNAGGSACGQPIPFTP